MELPIVAPAPVVGDHAAVFRDLFENQCQFRHFQHYLTGLIVLPNKSMANIARCTLDSADKTNLSRFLSEASWREDAVNHRRIRFMLQQTASHRRRRRDSIVVIDDTLCEHVGSLFDYVDCHYNHSDGTYPLAHNPVTSFHVSGPVRFPLGLRLYRRYEELTQWEAAVAKHFPALPIPTNTKARNRLHKQVDPTLLQDPEFRARHEQFRTKIALAVELVEEAIRCKVPFGVVVFDAWYLAEDVVRVLARRRKDWISLLKKNRLLETASFHLRDAHGRPLKLPSPQIAVEELVPLIPTNAYRVMLKNSAGFGSLAGSEFSTALKRSRIHANGFRRIRPLMPTLSRCAKSKNQISSPEYPDDPTRRRGGATMAVVTVERLDHLGLMAEVIKELGLIDMLDARLAPDRQEEITPGEAVAGMILNGLGFANRPLSLTPPFFANKPLDLLFREGVGAEMFNRFKLGRTLAEIYTSGCDLLFSELALAVCAQEGIDLRFNHLDTTSFSLSGEYVPDSDEQAITSTHGYSKDHRPDLQQAVLELMVSHDGGIPFVSQSWDGNAADTEIVQERAAALLATFQSSPTPRYLVADSKLYNEANAANLRALGLITRIPHTLKLVSQVITQALRWDTWQQLDDTTRYQRVELRHYGMSHRWLVVSSEAAWQRTEATISHARQREAEVIDKQLFHLQAKRFETPKAAQAALDTLAPAWKYHQVETYSLIDHKRYACKGRPTPTTPIKAIAWQIQARVRPDDEQIGQQKQLKACFVVGTTIDTSQLSDAEVIRAYKGQAQAEGGFRFLKDPLFFVSSLFVKKPCRIQGLLMVMTLALLVYSVTQRRLRHQLARQGETVPNQINQPTARPTLRWVFPLLEGIHRVRVTVPGKVHDLIEGLNHVQIKILRFFGEEVCRLYQISPG